MIEYDIPNKLSNVKCSTRASCSDKRMSRVTLATSVGAVCVCARVCVCVRVCVCTCERINTNFKCIMRASCSDKCVSRVIAML